MNGWYLQPVKRWKLEKRFGMRPKDASVYTFSGPGIKQNSEAQFMRALSRENTTCNFRIHLHKSTVCIRWSTIYTPHTDKHMWRRCWVRCNSGRRRRKDEWERKRGRCFTLDGSPSVPVTESGIKCCLDLRVDKNSCCLKTSSFINWRRNVEDGWAGRRGRRGRMKGRWKKGSSGGEEMKEERYSNYTLTIMCFISDILYWWSITQSFIHPAPTQRSVCNCTSKDGQGGGMKVRVKEMRSG